MSILSGRGELFKVYSQCSPSYCKTTLQRESWPQLSFGPIPFLLKKSKTKTQNPSECSKKDVGTHAFCSCAPSFGRLEVLSRQTRNFTISFLELLRGLSHQTCFTSMATPSSEHWRKLKISAFQGKWQFPPRCRACQRFPLHGDTWEIVTESRGGTSG